MSQDNASCIELEGPDRERGKTGEPRETSAAHGLGMHQDERIASCVLLSVSFQVLRRRLDVTINGDEDSARILVIDRDDGTTIRRIRAQSDERYLRVLPKLRGLY